MASGKRPPLGLLTWPPGSVGRRQIEQWIESVLGFLPTVRPPHPVGRATAPNRPVAATATPNRARAASASWLHAYRSSAWSTTPTYCCGRPLPARSRVQNVGVRPSGTHGCPRRSVHVDAPRHDATMPYRCRSLRRVLHHHSRPPSTSCTTRPLAMTAPTSSSSNCRRQARRVRRPVTGTWMPPRLECRRPHAQTARTERTVPACRDDRRPRAPAPDRCRRECFLRHGSHHCLPRA
jgi:hypothetical protein